MEHRWTIRKRRDMFGVVMSDAWTICRDGIEVGYAEHEKGYGIGPRWRWCVYDHPTDAWSDKWSYGSSLGEALNMARDYIGSKPTRKPR